MVNRTAIKNFLKCWKNLQGVKGLLHAICLPVWTFRKTCCVESNAQLEGNKSFLSDCRCFKHCWQIEADQHQYGGKNNCEANKSVLQLINSNLSCLILNT